MTLPVSISPWSTPVKVVSVHLNPGYYAVHQTNIQPSNQYTYQNVNFGSPNMLLNTSLGFYHNYNFPPLLVILIWSLFWFRQLRDLPSSDGYFIFTQHCSYRPWNLYQGCLLFYWAAVWVIIINPHPYILSSVSCSTSPQPAHGSIAYSQPYLTLGQTATYSCDDGYQLTGPRVRVCQADSTWTGFEPSCCEYGSGIGLMLSSLNYVCNAKLILGLRPANERRRYFVTIVLHWLDANLKSAL